MSSVQQPSPQCIYVPTKYASVYYNEECSLLLCRREAEESEYYVNDGSIISDTTESFDCNEMLHKPEEGAPQVSSPVWDHSTCRDEYFTDPHNLSEESLLSLHYSYGLEDSSNFSYLYAWLSSLDQETEEHYYSMTRIQLREMHLREKIFMQKPEEAVNPNYMTYRHFLVEWISDVCMELVLTPETLHTAVYLLDSFMSKQKLDHHFLQALSCACILVAGKQEEREENVPRVVELVQICRQSFSCETLLTMEKLLLQVLEWNVLTCNAIHFLRFFLFQWCTQCADRLQEKIYSIQSQAIGEIALYLINRSMTDKRCFVYSPSCLAAASVYCSLCALFGARVLEDASNLCMLCKDQDSFLGEYISKQVDLLNTWLDEKVSLQQISVPVRVRSPTSIQETMYSS